ncbi:MAG: methyltransferase domain-containing protein [Acidobacteria bacterium]|nr:methyltransferase domain-containing protein [Acidobacteriota bacterium]
MEQDKRARARELAQQYHDQGDSLGWFEALYREGLENPAVVPWAEQRPNRLMVEWAQREQLRGESNRALVVGCGLGDDAEYLAGAGFQVTAFDLAPTAVLQCRQRFPQSSVEYRAANLLDPPADWAGRFKFVLEVFTLQTLPPEVRAPALVNLAAFVAPGGTLLIICRAREPGDDPGSLPWPLTRHEMSRLEELGLLREGFEDLWDTEDPPVRRFRARYRRSV